MFQNGREVEVLLVLHFRILYFYPLDFTNFFLVFSVDFRLLISLKQTISVD